MKRNRLTHVVLSAAVLMTFLVVPMIAQAQGVIKIGAAMPITGRFAFAGARIHEGLSDYITHVNEQGGIGGKKLVYIFDDTEYKMDKAVAIFKRIMAKDNPLIFYGDSTGLGKAIAPMIRDKYKILYGSTSFSSELADRA
jgi:branched-chain amino acid transport system substrate-binding protein